MTTAPAPAIDRAVTTLADLHETHEVTVELFVERKRGDECYLVDGAVEEREAFDEAGFAVTVAAGGGIGRIAVNSLDADRIQLGLRTAAERAGVRVPAGELASAVAEVVARWCAERTTVPNEWIDDVLHTAYAGARAAGTTVSSVSASFSGVHRDVLLLGPAGAHVAAAENRYLMTCRAIADAAGSPAVGYRKASARDLGPWLASPTTPSSIGSDAGSAAVAKVGACLASGDNVTVVVGAGFSGVLAHELIGHPLESDVAANGSAGPARRPGERIGIPELAVTDDPNLPGGWGSYRHDDEGQSAPPLRIVRDGHVAELIDGSGRRRRESFAHLPLPRMSNVYLESGSAEPSALVAEVDDGYYLSRLGGGNVTEDGRFTAGAVDIRRIERGRLTEPVADSVISGDVTATLASIRGIGNDSRMGSPASCVKYGQEVPVGDGGPTLLVTGMTIGPAE